MIVDPDFLDHWRTRMVVDALGGDEMAPMYVLRLWAHCQQRRSSSFQMPAAGLKALCRYKGDAEALEAALIDAGFVERNGGEIVLPKWAEHNAKLIANWTNGATGGRPKKTEEEPTENPTETQPEPTETHAEPIREEKSREEQKGSKAKTKAPAEPSPLELLAEAGVAEQVAKDWVKHRKAKRNSCSQTVLEERQQQAQIAGIALEDALRLEVSRGWQGFQAEWLQPKQARASPQGYESPKDRSRREAAEKLTGRKSNDERSFIDIN